MPPRQQADIRHEPYTEDRDYHQRSKDRPGLNPQDFRLRDSRLITMSWGLMGFTAYASYLLHLFKTSAAEGSTGGGEDARPIQFDGRAVDMACALALALSCLTISGTSLGTNVCAQQVACGSLGVLCSCWYFLGLFVVRGAHVVVWTIRPPQITQANHTQTYRRVFGGRITKSSRPLPSVRVEW